MELFLFLPSPGEALALPLGKHKNDFIPLALHGQLTLWLKCRTGVLPWERHWLDA